MTENASVLKAFKVKSPQMSPVLRRYDRLEAEAKSPLHLNNLKDACNT